MDTSSIIESPLIDSSQGRHMRRTESNVPQSRFLLVPIIMFFILETVAAIAGFILGYREIVSDGKHVQFSWEEYIAISAYEAVSIPTNLFDILILEIIKSFVLVISFLIFRFNYRIRRLQRFRISIYSLLFINTLYVTSKIWGIHGTVENDLALPVPRSFALGMSFVVLIITVFQMVLMVLFLKKYTRDLDNDIRDGLPLSRSTSEAQFNIIATPINTFLDLIKVDYSLVVFGFVCLLINTISQLSIPHFLGQLVDALINRSVDRNLDSEGVFSILYSLLFVIFVSAVTGYLRSFAFSICGYRLSRRLRSDLVHAISCQEMGFFEFNSPAFLKSVVLSDVESLQDALSSDIPMLGRFIFQFSCSIILMISLSWKLSLIIFSCTSS